MSWSLVTFRSSSVIWGSCCVIIASLELEYTSRCIDRNGRADVEALIVPGDGHHDLDGVVYPIGCLAIHLDLGITRTIDPAVAVQQCLLGPGADLIDVINMG